MDLSSALTVLSKYINLRKNKKIFIKLAKDGHVDLVEAFIKLGVDVHAGLATPRPDKSVLMIMHFDGHLRMVI
jgi:hypothetical protein